MKAHDSRMISAQRERWLAAAPVRGAFTVLALAVSMCCFACGSDVVKPPPPPPPPPDGTITALVPASAFAGDGDLRVTIQGIGFDGEGVSRSIAYWFAGGTKTALDTEVVCSTQLSVLVPAALLSTPGSASIAVALRDSIEQSTGGSGNHLEFTIAQRTPQTTQITSLEPASAVAGSGDTKVRILGTGLHRSWHVVSVAVWVDGRQHTPLATSAVGDAELTAVIPAALLRTPTQAAIRVQLSDVMEGFPEGGSNDFAFAVE